VARRRRSARGTRRKREPEQARAAVTGSVHRRVQPLRASRRFARSRPPTTTASASPRAGLGEGRDRKLRDPPPTARKKIMNDGEQRSCGPGAILPPARSVYGVSRALEWLVSCCRSEDETAPVQPWVSVGHARVQQAFLRATRRGRRRAAVALRRGQRRLLPAGDITSSTWSRPHQRSMTLAAIRRNPRAGTPTIKELERGVDQSAGPRRSLTRRLADAVLDGRGAARRGAVRPMYARSRAAGL